MKLRVTDGIAQGRERRAELDARLGAARQELDSVQAEAEERRRSGKATTPEAKQRERELREEAKRLRSQLEKMEATVKGHKERFATLEREEKAMHKALLEAHAPGPAPFSPQLCALRAAVRE